MGVEAGELSQRAVEALVSQAYRVGRITHAQAGQILGLDRWQTDEFLKSERAYRSGEQEEFTSDLSRLRLLQK